MWKIDTLYGTIIPLIQIYRNTDTEWIIRAIRVYKSETNGDVATSNGYNINLTIYYI